MTLAPGFDVDEAVTLLEICQRTYHDTPTLSTAATVCDLPPVPDPSGWTLDTDLTPTTATPLDNYWQVWRSDSDPNRYAIAVRGTVDTAPSIFADIFLPLINARFDITLGPATVPFHLARDEGATAVRAGVHAGFALGLVLMLLTTDKPLLLTLGRLALAGNDVYITGHSQGASLATLLTSFINHSPTFSRAGTKTYVFAPAKSGNDHYAFDYAQLVGVPGRGWSLASSQGWVPQAPLTLQGTWDLNTPNPLVAYDGAANPDLPRALQALVERIDDGPKDAVEALVELLKHLIGELDDKLMGETLHLTAADLGGEGDTPLAGSTIVSVLDQILDQVQASLNYCLVGSVVPLFAVPGGNPTDGTPGCQKFDFFWQHHLGNYLKYLKEQYGG